MHSVDTSLWENFDSKKGGQNHFVSKNVNNLINYSIKTEETRPKTIFGRNEPGKKEVKPNENKDRKNFKLKI